MLPVSHTHPGNNPDDPLRRRRVQDLCEHEPGKGSEDSPEYVSYVLILPERFEDFCRIGQHYLTDNLWQEDEEDQKDHRRTCECERDPGPSGKIHPGREREDPCEDCGHPDLAEPLTFLSALSTREARRPHIPIMSRVRPSKDPANAAETKKMSGAPSRRLT